MTHLFHVGCGRLGRDERGAVSIFGLFIALTVLIPGGVAVDMASLVAKRTKLQVAADSAAHAAMYYRQSMSEDEAISRAVAIAQATVPADRNRDAIRFEDIQFGYWDGTTFVSNSGSTQAVQVSTGTTRARGTGAATFLLRLVGVSTVDLETSAIFATPGEGGCIYTLDPAGTGVTLSDGTKIDAPECAVISNADVTNSCGTGITTARLIHEGTVNDCPWGESIVNAEGGPAPRRQKHSEDPLAGNHQVQVLHDRFSDVRIISWPDPLVVSSGTDINFGYSDLTTAEVDALAASGCSATHPAWSPTWSVTCTGSEVNLGGINTGGGITVDFNSAGSVGTVYNFSETVTHGGGSSLRFGSGTFNLAGGVSGSDIRFRSGDFHIGTVTSGCGYSICDYGTITFEGSGSYILDSGVTVGGGSTLSFGVGAHDNTYVVGANSSGVSFNLDGSARVEFGDAINAVHGFRVQGLVNANGGGSCAVFPATENHDFAESINLAGAAVLGAGAYHVDGTFRAGTGGASCGGSSAVSGTDVTLVISGRGPQIYDSGWYGERFCVGGGNQVTLVAPATGPNASMGVLGPLDRFAGGAKMDAAGSSRLSGVMYFPNAPILLNGGGGSLSGSSSSDCLQIIGSEITLAGGTATASECVDLPGSGRMALVY